VNASGAAPRGRKAEQQQQQKRFKRRNDTMPPKTKTPAKPHALTRREQDVIKNKKELVRQAKQTAVRVRKAKPKRPPSRSTAAAAKKAAKVTAENNAARAGPARLPTAPTPKKTPERKKSPSPGVGKSPKDPAAKQVLRMANFLAANPVGKQKKIAFRRKRQS
jgi:hypothetical protein